MKKYVKIYNKEHLDKIDNVHIDHDGDYNSMTTFAYIKRYHVGKIIDVYEFVYYHNRELDWAIEEVLTKEKYPEYYL